ncbi:MAG: hypothetical protein M3R31_12785 [Pseudomonadota bacterium]|nr:hypothetical protein [Pseudomonadota bacterium]
MLKRLLPVVLSLALLALPLRAAAADYTDIWYLLSESGWGVNLIQAEDVIFATFFIYGPDNRPTWYVAIIYRDANGNFAGSLYSTVGPYFGGPWNPANYAATLAGTASFYPSSAYQGTLVYSLASGPTVTKTIQRQTLKTINLNGNYTGGQAGAYSGCGSASSYKDNFDLQVTQFDNGTATFQFTYTSGLSCTLSGTLAQYGQLYTIPSASYVCSDGLNTTASMSEIKATAQGIEGRLAAASVGDGCREDASFSGVLLSP